MLSKLVLCSAISRTSVSVFVAKENNSSVFSHGKEEDSPLGLIKNSLYSVLVLMGVSVSFVMMRGSCLKDIIAFSDVIDLISMSLSCLLCSLVRPDLSMRDESEVVITGGAYLRLRPRLEYDLFLC